MFFPLPRLEGNATPVRKLIQLLLLLVSVFGWCLAGFRWLLPPLWKVLHMLQMASSPVPPHGTCLIGKHGVTMAWRRLGTYADMLDNKLYEQGGQAKPETKVEFGAGLSYGIQNRHSAAHRSATAEPSTPATCAPSRTGGAGSPTKSNPRRNLMAGRDRVWPRET